MLPDVMTWRLIENRAVLKSDEENMWVSDTVKNSDKLAKLSYVFGLGVVPVPGGIKIVPRSIVYRAKAVSLVPNVWSTLICPYCSDTGCGKG